MTDNAAGSTATSAPPAATRLLGIAELTEILAQLDRPVTDAGNGPPEVTALHLTRVLVAAAEQQAVAAEIALARANNGVLPDGDQVDAHQATYDPATPKGALELLGVCHWRAQRLRAAVEAVAGTFIQADTSGTPTHASPLVLMWDLAVPAAAAPESLLAFLAGTATGDAGTGTVAALDAATALLMNAGDRARRLRAQIGLDT